MKKTNKILAFALAVLLLALPLSSCGGSGKNEKDLRTVMTIDGFEVPYEQFRYFFMNYKAQLEKADENVWSGSDKKQKEAELDASVTGALKGLYAVLDLCKKYGISPDDKSIKDAVQEKIEETKDSYENEKKYRSALESNYMNESVYGFLIAVDLCETELYNKMIEAKEIDDSDEAALANIKGADFIRTIQILIKNDAGDDVAENRKTANELLERIKKGEDFDKLIGRYSEDLSMTPDGYYSTRLEMLKEYEEAAYKLEIGEVSEVVESSVGFHIIKRLSKEDEYITKNFDALKEKYLTSAFFSKIEKKKAEQNVVKNSLYDSFNVDNMN